MDLFDIHEFCMSLPDVTTDQAFGEDYVLFRVENKIFACISVERRAYPLTLKLNSDYGILMRDRHYDLINPAWHWNKKYWSELAVDRLPDDVIKHLICHAYNEVLLKLPRKLRELHPKLEAGEFLNVESVTS